MSVRSHVHAVTRTRRSETKPWSSHASCPDPHSESDRSRRQPVRHRHQADRTGRPDRPRRRPDHKVRLDSAWMATRMVCTSIDVSNACLEVVTIARQIAATRAGCTAEEVPPELLNRLWTTQHRFLSAVGGAGAGHHAAAGGPGVIREAAASSVKVRRDRCRPSVEPFRLCGPPRSPGDNGVRDERGCGERRRPR